jgi:protein-S-isoprenylcysteine O-methyltransferase
MFLFVIFCSSGGARFSLIFLSFPAAFLLPPSHSNEFAIAFVAAIAEYTIERYLFGLSGYRLMVLPGILLVLVGQAARTLAMATAGMHFHHLVRDEREEKHKLVTHGIYSKLRHPSYFGFFYWAIGMQLVLCNPIMACLNAYASFMFFKGRIAEEEKSLVQFFGKDYERYRATTQIGIPGL